MPAYVLIDIQVHDPVKFEEYKKKAPPSIAAYDGKYLCPRWRGRNARWHVGAAAHRRSGVSVHGACREWYHCEMYAEAIKLRHASATSKFILVEGL